MLSKKTIVTLAAVLGLAAAGAFAAPARASFEKVPLEAKRALGATVGKPIIKGVVFLNGHLIDFGASCQVVRSGTAIYLRQKKGEKKVDLQVTPPLKPWNAFLETQDSSVVVAVEEEAPAPAIEAPTAVSTATFSFTAHSHLIVSLNFAMFSRISVDGVPG